MCAWPHLPAILSKELYKTTSLRLGLQLTGANVHTTPYERVICTYLDSEYVLTINFLDDKTSVIKNVAYGMQFLLSIQTTKTLYIQCTHTQFIATDITG